MSYKPGVYREPINGHTVKYPADGTGAPPPGYEWIATVEDFRAGKVPKFEPARTAEELFERRSKPLEEAEVVSRNSVKKRGESDDKARDTAANKSS